MKNLGALSENAKKAKVRQKSNRFEYPYPISWIQCYGQKSKQPYHATVPLTPRTFAITIVLGSNN
jgi:hypothetical protein